MENRLGESSVNLALEPGLLDETILSFGPETCMGDPQ